MPAPRVIAAPRGKSSPACELDSLEPRLLLAANPVLLRDITPGATGSQIPEIEAVGNTAFFIEGHSLWKTDGTPRGTVKLRHGALGGSLREPQNLHAFGNNRVFFIGGAGSSTNDTSGTYLWISDGTARGTRPIRKLDGPTFNDGVSGEMYGEQLGSQFIFSTRDRTGRFTLWRSNGTGRGTVPIRTFQSTGGQPANFIRLGNRLMFTYTDLRLGTEWWSTNGTAAGTFMLRDASPGFGADLHKHDGLAPAAILGNRLYFVARDSTNPGNLQPDWLWSTAGTPATTQRHFNLGGSTKHLTTVGNQLYYFANNLNSPFKTLFRTRGTAGSTAALSELIPIHGLEDDLAVAGNRVFFIATHLSQTNNRWALFASNGGAPQRIGPLLQPGVGPPEVYAVGNHVLFTHNSATPGNPLSMPDLWLSNGTAAGTRRVGNLDIGLAGTHGNAVIAVAGNRAFFAANNGVHGNEIWTLNTAPAARTAGVSEADAPAGSAAVAAWWRQQRQGPVVRGQQEDAAEADDLLAEPEPLYAWSA